MRPGTYLDRAGRNKNKFVFISYSHRDEEYVFKILNELYQAGVNYWYDTELKDGEVWNEEIDEILTSSNCIGAVFMFSEKSIVSSAVAREVRMVNARKEKDKNNFFVLPVLIDLNNFQDLIVKLAGSEEYKSVGDYASLLQNEDRTMILDKDQAASRIISFCERIGASEKNYLEIRDTNFSALDGRKVYYYEIGSYPSEPSGKPVPIRWKLFFREKNILYFVSEYCLDFVEYENALNLNKARFGLEKKESVVFFGLLDKENLERYSETIGQAIPTDYADFKRTQSFRTFWVTDGSDQLLLYNNMNEYIEEEINSDNDTFTAGIRLMLRLDDNKISIEE